VIKIEGLVFAYPGQRPIFEDFDWEAAAGDAWAIIGPSGCGKSTLLYLIAGLRPPLAGRVLVNGRPVPRPRASTGLVIQDYGLLPWATVWDNVALPLRLGRFYGGKDADNPERPYPRSDISPAQVDYWLRRLGIAEIGAKYPAQISGGQRQRTAIGRALLQQPNLLLLDEPFSSLDALTREDLQQLAVDLRQETAVTTLVVTHNIEEAVFLGQRILVLDHPPNRTARVIENSEAGTRDFRGKAAYYDKCNEVRAILEGAR